MLLEERIGAGRRLEPGDLHDEVVLDELVAVELRPRHRAGDPREHFAQDRARLRSIVDPVVSAAVSPGRLASSTSSNGIPKTVVTAPNSCTRSDTLARTGRSISVRSRSSSGTTSGGDEYCTCAGATFLPTPIAARTPSRQLASEALEVDLEADVEGEEREQAAGSDAHAENLRSGIGRTQRAPDDGTGARVAAIPARGRGRGAEPTQAPV